MGHKPSKYFIPVQGGVITRSNSCAHTFRLSASFQDKNQIRTRSGCLEISVLVRPLFDQFRHSHYPTFSYVCAIIMLLPEKLQDSSNLKKLQFSNEVQLRSTYLIAIPNYMKVELVLIWLVPNGTWKTFRRFSKKPTGKKKAPISSIFHQSASSCKVQSTQEQAWQNRKERKLLKSHYKLSW